MEYVIDIAVFFLKLFIFVFAVLFLVSGLLSLNQKGKRRSQDKLSITSLNEQFHDLADTIASETLPKKAYKLRLKNARKKQKQEDKQFKTAQDSKKRVYVIDFNGDIRASASTALCQEITGLLNVARPQDEIVCRLESAGGMVHAYGYAASQLARLRAQNLPLTVSIDKIAASGGYLMSTVANTIIAAPYAIIGSVGVVAQFPNFNRLLKKHAIDYELLTAGEYKRTVSMFGSNTYKGRKKFLEELEAIHQQFKNTIVRYRPQIDIQQIATGEHWLAEKALTLNLVDQLTTSDDYLLRLAETCDVYQVKYQIKKSLSEKVSGMTLALMSAITHKVQDINHRWWS